MSAAGIVSGNRCGHDPRRPRLELQIVGTRGKPFPHLIGRLLERLDGLYFDRALFPELGARKRSERIEAMVLVIKAIARTTDRLSLRSGRRNADGTMTGIPMHTIATWARLAEQRAFRALWDLRDAGFVDLYQPVEQRADGSWRGLAGIRRLTKKLFERVGLGQRLRRERSELWRAERAKQSAQTIAQRRQLRRVFRESVRARVLARRATDQLAGQKSAESDGGAERARLAREELARRLAERDGDK